MVLSPHEGRHGGPGAVIPLISFASGASFFLWLKNRWHCINQGRPGNHGTGFLRHGWENGTMISGTGKWYSYRQYSDRFKASAEVPRQTVVLWYTYPALFSAGLR